MSKYLGLKVELQKVHVYRQDAESVICGKTGKGGGGSKILRRGRQKWTSKARRAESLRPQPEVRRLKCQQQAASVLVFLPRDAMRKRGTSRRRVFFCLSHLCVVSNRLIYHQTFCAARYVILVFEAKRSYTFPTGTLSAGR